MEIITTDWSSDSQTAGNTGFTADSVFANIPDSDYSHTKFILKMFILDLNSDTIYEVDAGTYTVDLPFQKDCNTVSDSYFVTAEEDFTKEVNVKVDFADYNDEFVFDQLNINTSTEEITEVFEGVSIDHIFAPYIFNLKANGVIGEYGDGTFKSSNNMTGEVISKIADKER